MNKILRGRGDLKIMAVFTSVKLLNEKTDLFLLRVKVKSNKGRLGTQYEEETAYVEDNLNVD